MKNLLIIYFILIPFFDYNKKENKKCKYREITIKGKIVSKTGFQILMGHASLKRIEKGKICKFYRRFEKKKGRLTISGWVNIAKVEIEKNQSRRILLKIKEENDKSPDLYDGEDKYKNGIWVKVTYEEF